MKIIVKLSVLSFLFFLSCIGNNKINSTVDKSLIIPGKSAEGYMLGELIEESVLSTCLENEKSISEIMGIELFSDLKFDCISSDNKTSVIFLKNGIIVAIAGVKTERRITSDGVLLSRGVDDFILNYGNSRLLNFSTGKHRVYLYKDSGIAIFDDNCDNSIDMYLIFKTENNSTSSIR